MRLSQFEKKYKSTMDAKKDSAVKPKVIFAPDVAKFKMELFGKKTNNLANVLDFGDNQEKGFNDLLPHKKDSLTNGKFFYLFHSILVDNFHFDIHTMDLFVWI